MKQKKNKQINIQDWAKTCTKLSMSFIAMNMMLQVLNETMRIWPRQHLRELNQIGATHYDIKRVKKTERVYVLQKELEYSVESFLRKHKNYKSEVININESDSNELCCYYIQLYRVPKPKPDPNVCKTCGHSLLEDEYD